MKVKTRSKKKENIKKNSLKKYQVSKGNDCLRQELGLILNISDPVT